MNDCDIIKDLLPLYTEDICSEASKEMVSEHLNECASCRTALEAMKTDFNKEEVTQGTEPLKKLGKKLKKEKSKAFRRGVAITLTVLVLVPLLFAKGIGTAELRETLKSEQQASVYKIIQLEPGKKGAQNFTGIKLSLPDGLKQKQSKTSVYYANDDESVRMVINDATEMYPYADVTANYPFMTNKRITDFMAVRTLVTRPDLMRYCLTYNSSGLNFFTGFSKLKESLYVCLISQSVVPVCDSFYWVEGLGFDCIVMNLEVDGRADGQIMTYYMADISDGIRTWSLCLMCDADLEMTETFYDVLRSVSFDY